MNAGQRISVQVINGFIDKGKGGNPAGLVMNADKLSHAEKQAIAAKAGLSETAFVSASALADYKFDFFTPTKQIPHCGHATIAAFSFFYQEGLLKKDVSSKETIDGVRKILIKEENAFMEQKAPLYTSVKNEMDNILGSLGLAQEDLLTGQVPAIVNTGNSFLLLGVRDNQVLRRIRYDTAMVYAICEKYDLVGFYPFSFDTIIPGRDATTRMFGPYYGITEESATGMAAGPLACYLFDQCQVIKERFLVEQGHFMQEASPSLIIVDLQIENGRIKGLMAGGKGNAVKELIVEL